MGHIGWATEESVAELELAADVAEVICLWHNIWGPRPVGWDGSGLFNQESEPLIEAWLCDGRPTFNLARLILLLEMFASAPLRGTDVMVSLIQRVAEDLHNKLVSCFVQSANDVRDRVNIKTAPFRGTSALRRRRCLDARRGEAAGISPV